MLDEPLCLRTAKTAADSSVLLLLHSMKRLAQLVDNGNSHTITVRDTVQKIISVFYLSALNLKKKKISTVICIP